MNTLFKQINSTLPAIIQPSSTAGGFLLSRLTSLILRRYHRMITFIMQSVHFDVQWLIYSNHLIDYLAAKTNPLPSGSPFRNVLSGHIQP